MARIVVVKPHFFQALLKLFGETSREREILRSDFHVPSHIDPNALTENHFFIDVTIEFPEVISEDSIAKSTVPPFFGNFIIEEGGKSTVYKNKTRGYMAEK
ncbi:hypothetical protein ACT7DI_12610 [Bacillus paranthracis]